MLFFLDFLVDLITVETQSFGESALGGIKVTEYRPPRMPQPRPHLSAPSRPVMGPPATPSGVPQQHYQSPRAAGPPPPVPAGMTLMMQRQRAPLIPGGNVSRPNIVSMASAQPSPYRAIQPKPPSGLMPQQQKSSLLAATPENLATMNPEQVSLCVSRQHASLSYVWSYFLAFHVGTCMILMFQSF